MHTHLRLALFLACCCAPTASYALSQVADSNTVTIFRDAFGVPHIFAPDETKVFEAYGYTVAEDRLWQLELNRRAARGQLAQILGARFVEADRLVRVTGYTEAELQAQFAGLPAVNRAHIVAYVAGINRYIRDIIAPDPNHTLPMSFAPWASPRHPGAPPM